MNIMGAPKILPETSFLLAQTEGSYGSFFGKSTIPNIRKKLSNKK